MNKGCINLETGTVNIFRCRLGRLLQLSPTYFLFSLLIRLIFGYVVLHLAAPPSLLDASSDEYSFHGFRRIYPRPAIAIILKPAPGVMQTNSVGQWTGRRLSGPVNHWQNNAFYLQAAPQLAEIGGYLWMQPESN